MLINYLWNASLYKQKCTVCRHVVPSSVFVFCTWHWYLFTRKVDVHESAQAERHKAFILVSSCRLGLRGPGGVNLFEPPRDTEAQKDLHLSACLDLSPEGAHMDFIPDSAWTHECLLFCTLGLMRLMQNQMAVSLCQHLSFKRMGQ